MPAEVTCEHCGASVVVPEDPSAVGVTCSFCQQWITLHRAPPRAPLVVGVPQRRFPVGIMIGVGAALAAILTIVWLSGKITSPAPPSPSAATTVDSVATPAASPSAAKPSYLREIESFGGHGGLAGQLMRGNRIAVDGAGNVWASDVDSPRLQKLDAHGKQLLQITLDEKDLPVLVGLVADAKGNVFADSDAEHGVIVVFSADDGHVIRRIPTPKDVDRWYDLVVDQTGALYAIAEDAGSQYFVVKMDATGKILARFEKTKKDDLAERRPAIDDEGDLHVAHPFERKVYVHDPKGAIVNRWGSAGNGPGDFDLGLEALAWDFHGHVLAANDGVQVFDREGRFLGRFAETLNAPEDLAMAPDGTLYVLADDVIHHYALDPSALGK